MVVGYDWEHDSAARYAVMDAVRISERRVGIPRDDVCGVSVIARAVFTGRKRARVVGDADPYG